MIPEAAVEAAKEAMREVTPPAGVGKSDWLAKYGDWSLLAGALAAALEAAAPHLLAEAWDDAYAAGFQEGAGFGLRPNPYRPTP